METAIFTFGMIVGALLLCLVEKFAEWHQEAMAALSEEEPEEEFPDSSDVFPYYPPDLPPLLRRRR